MAVWLVMAGTSELANLRKANLNCMVTTNKYRDGSANEYNRVHYENCDANLNSDPYQLVRSCIEIVANETCFILEKSKSLYQNEKIADLLLKIAQVSSRSFEELIYSESQKILKRVFGKKITKETGWVTSSDSNE